MRTGGGRGDLTTRDVFTIDHESSYLLCIKWNDQVLHSKVIPVRQKIQLAALTFALLATWNVHAWIIPSDRGEWPVSWPKELEELRPIAKSLDCATGLQECIYTIPFDSKEDFEKYWPSLMMVRTPGSTLTLSKVDEIEPGWGKLLTNAKPCVRIRGPVASVLARYEKSFGSDLSSNDPEAESIRELVGPHGELPEYVTQILVNRATPVWRDSGKAPENVVGFKHRLRVDIELVVDGDVIDLNRIPLPQDSRIIDRRFPAVQVPKR
ncbi:hypothetical protein [Schlesneria paludicola]|uniref:hypothetical protein n=1 Tax=Schlesneria paludicola TaxID=360056 RepID=UPI00029A2CED|nr:hypothetical protein [Schlesneria paludicola]